MNINFKVKRKPYVPLSDMLEVQRQNDNLREECRQLRIQNHSLSADLSQLQTKHTHDAQNIYEACNFLGNAVSTFRRAGYNV